MTTIQNQTATNSQNLSLITLTKTTECRILGDRYSLIVPTSGICHLFSDKKYALKKGDVLLVKNSFPYTLKSVSITSANAYVITFGKEYADNFLLNSEYLQNTLQSQTTVLSSLSSCTADYLQHLLGGIYTISNDKDTIILTALNAIFCDINYNTNTLSAKNSIEFLATHLQKTADNMLCVSERIYDIYEKYPCSHTALISAFTALTGETPIDYIAKTRINFAKSLLQNTTLSVKDISEVLSYKSVSHFIKKFKQSIGLTPFTFRQK